MIDQKLLQDFFSRLVGINFEVMTIPPFALPDWPASEQLTKVFSPVRCFLPTVVGNQLGSFALFGAVVVQISIKYGDHAGRIWINISGGDKNFGTVQLLRTSEAQYRVLSYTSNEGDSLVSSPRDNFRRLACLLVFLQFRDEMISATIQHLVDRHYLELAEKIRRLFPTSAVELIQTALERMDDGSLTDNPIRIPIGLAFEPFVPSSLLDVLCR